MKLPILAYGHPVLRGKNKNINKNYPGLKQLIDDMWETMYAARGAGLAAPQVGKNIRLFIVDTVQSYNNSSFRERRRFLTDKGIKEVFINPQIIETAGSKESEHEGCLSFPELDLEIERNISIIIKYYDENFNEKETFFSGATARAVKHEYDHIEGILFIDYVDQEKIKEDLAIISSGQVRADYKIKFYR